MQFFIIYPSLAYHLSSEGKEAKAVASALFYVFPTQC